MCGRRRSTGHKQWLIGISPRCHASLLLKLHGLDVEPQRGADAADVFTVELLHHCGLSRVVQPTAKAVEPQLARVGRRIRSQVPISNWHQAQ